jgi:hypothetical protein
MRRRATVTISKSRPQRDDATPFISEVIDMALTHGS